MRASTRATPWQAGQVGGVGGDGLLVGRRAGADGRRVGGDDGQGAGLLRAEVGAEDVDSPAGCWPTPAAPGRRAGRARCRGRGCRGAAGATMVAERDRARAAASRTSRRGARSPARPASPGAGAAAGRSTLAAEDGEHGRQHDDGARGRRGRRRRRRRRRTTGGTSAGTPAARDSEAATVRALKATVRPAVRTVRRTAAAGSWPAASSSRYRETTKRL